MDNDSVPTIFDLPELRDRVHVFRDRAHAGKILVGMLEPNRGGDSIVLAIPAGGVPVGAVLAEQLSLALDVAVVSKITLPWNTEAGYGAVAFDGTVRLNDGLLLRLGLTKEEVGKGIEKTSSKVAQRVNRLRRGRPFPDLSKRSVILVDDGLASGFTMRVAVEALRKAGAGHIIVGTPTGYRGPMERIAGEVEALYCPNIRSGLSFAVADAYERWSDVDEDEVIRILEGFVGGAFACQPAARVF
ncbi:MAG: phosphoribosyltransferase [Desulfobacterales bacterium]|nr:phosphoribosyltransferase [Desulfobacterales bacterium]